MSVSIAQSVDSRLKGISVKLLEKIRTNEAAKASAFDENEWRLKGDLKRLPEIAFMLQVMFMTRKKNALPREEVIDNIIRTYSGRRYPTIISRENASESLNLVLKHIPEWIQTFTIRNQQYIKLNAQIDFETVRAKLDYKNTSRSL